MAELYALREMETLCKFSAIFGMGDNFPDFLFWFSAHGSPLK